MKTLILFVLVLGSASLWAININIPNLIQTQVKGDDHTCKALNDEMEKLKFSEMNSFFSNADRDIIKSCLDNPQVSSKVRASIQTNLNAIEKKEAAAKKLTDSEKPIIPKNCKGTEGEIVLRDIDHAFELVELDAKKGKMISLDNICDGGKTIENYTLMEYIYRLNVALIQTREKYGIDNPSDDGPSIFVNPTIKCKYSSFALDYKACRNLVNLYNGSFVAEGVLATGQQISQVEAQRDATQMVANPNNIQTSGLDATGRIVDNQKKIETQKSVFYTANAVAIGHGLMNWPTLKWTNREECKDEIGKTNCDVIRIHTENSRRTSSVFFMNDNLKGFFVAEVVKYSGKAAMHGVLAHEYGKSQKQIDAAKEDIMELQGDMNGIDVCADNPNLSGCTGYQKGTTSQIGNVGLGGFEIGGGANTAFNPSVLEDDSGSSLNSNGLSDSDIAAIEGGLVNLDSKGPVGMKDVAPGAATFKAGAQGGAGGGAGAGGGGGGSGPGLSDGPGAQDGKDSKSELLMGSSNMQFQEGGMARFASGRGAKDDNPFSGLLGKKKDSKGGVEVDRSLAGGINEDKSSGLFKKISTRYGKVLETNRLEKEELK